MATCVIPLGIVVQGRCASRRPLCCTSWEVLVIRSRIPWRPWSRAPACSACGWDRLDVPMRWLWRFHRVCVPFSPPHPLSLPLPACQTLCPYGQIGTAGTGTRFTPLPVFVQANGGLIAHHVGGLPRISASVLSDASQWAVWARTLSSGWRSLPLRAHSQMARTRHPSSTNAC